eukprot:GFYU01011295.1.p2 GENE.GFYU01011295.1~~GFYU01011295.1.p2  ORF type:complete len:289 (-),score=-18.77 GFYU01011295.1:1072-1938(-)
MMLVFCSYYYMRVGSFVGRVCRFKVVILFLLWAVAVVPCSSAADLVLSFGSGQLPAAAEEEDKGGGVAACPRELRACCCCCCSLSARGSALAGRGMVVGGTLDGGGPRSAGSDDDGIGVSAESPATPPTTTTPLLDEDDGRVPELGRLRGRPPPRAEDDIVVAARDSSRALHRCFRSACRACWARARLSLVNSPPMFNATSCIDRVELGDTRHHCSAAGSVGGDGEEIVVVDVVIGCLVEVVGVDVDVATGRDRLLLPPPNRPELLLPGLDAGTIIAMEAGGEMRGNR